MEIQNLTEGVTVADQLTPAAARAAGTYATGWIDASRFQRLAAVLQTGTIAGTGTLNMRWQSATATNGAGSADINSTSCITSTFASTSNDKVALLELRLDQNPSTARYVRAFASTANSTWIGGIVVLGTSGIHEPTSGYKSADVVATTVF
jgi:hypothetical protein